jgi:hypothetical protein
MATSKKMHEAYASGKEMTDRIVKLGGRCMEQLVDKQCALFMERWLLPNGVGLMVIYSPMYREVFIEAAPKIGTWDATDAALAAAAAIP